MTTDALTTDDELDADLAGWQADPSPRHPHVALLLGGSLLVVTLACMVPLFVVQGLKPGMAPAGLMLTVVVTIGSGMGPFLSARLQTTRYVVGALLLLDLLPLVLAVFLADGAPVRQWSSLILIPVLIAAATLNRRLYQVELVAGGLVGIAIMAVEAPTVVEGLLSCVAFAFFIVVCATLARHDRAALDLRFRQWQRRSRTDDLTGLFNRRGFVAHFPEVREACLEMGVSVGVVMIDIDHFSLINAERGHAYGDAVLQRLCAVVAGLPEVGEGLVARIGGEELLVVVPRPADTTATALRAALGRSEVHPGLTVSMGICDADPRTCGDAEAMWRLVNQADAAMYQAKAAGRNRFVRAPEPWCDGAAGSAATAPRPAGHVPPSHVDPGSGHEPSMGGARPTPPRLSPRLAGGVAAVMTSEPVVPAEPDQIGDDRLFGAYCLVFAAIGLDAYLTPVAISPDSAWVPVFLVSLAAMALLGLVTLMRRHQGPPLLTGLTCVMIEVATSSAVLATENVEHRLMIVCVLTVPVLVSAHAMPLPWLGGQIVLVFCGVGLAAGGGGDSIDAEWLHRTLSLAAAICAAPGVLFWLRRRREQANSRLRRLASIDPLTGVFNRAGLERSVRYEEGRGVHVLAFDIVGFKSLNDTYGHVFGDEVLVHVAHGLAGAVASAASTAAAGVRSPVLGRTGGDRFVVVGPEPLDPALPERIRRLLQSFPTEVTVSVGIAAGPVGTAAELWTLIAVAEAALVRPDARRRPGSGGATGPRSIR